MHRREFMSIVIPLAVVGPHYIFSKVEPAVTFGVIADPQYADQDTKGTRFYRASLEKLNHAVNALNKEDLDFVVTLGDVIDKDYSSFAKILPIYDLLKVPHRLVLGNHDFDVDDGNKKNIVQTLGLKMNYYSEVNNGWRFIYLDGTEESLFRYPENSAEWQNSKDILDDLVENKVPQAAVWNGGMSTKQMAWLKDELEEAVQENEWVVLSNHYPVLPEGDGHNLWNAEEVVELISQYDHITLYMNGHNHSGNYAINAGTHFVNFKGMVETENETAYAVVKCYSDRVEIKGYGLEPDRICD